VIASASVSSSVSSQYIEPVRIRLVLPPVTQQMAVPARSMRVLPTLTDISQGAVAGSVESPHVQACAAFTVIVVGGDLS
jgi:hypothetical protein